MNEDYVKLSTTEYIRLKRAEQNEKKHTVIISSIQYASTLSYNNGSSGNTNITVNTDAEDVKLLAEELKLSITNKDKLIEEINKLYMENQSSDRIKRMTISEFRKWRNQK